LKGVNGSIIADDLLVKKFGRGKKGYFRAIFSDSKLTSKAPWTENQLSELITVFEKTSVPYITFTMKSTKETLLRNAELVGSTVPKGFKQDVSVRIYREDVFKIVGNGRGQVGNVIKLNDVNFK